jgi:hypothetical protein
MQISYPDIENQAEGFRVCVGSTSFLGSVGAANYGLYFILSVIDFLVQL